MNAPNPLIPQGSLETQQFKKRSATKIAVSVILAIHGVVLGGLLFLGCKEEPGTQTADDGLPANTQFTDVNRAPVSADPFGDLPLATNDIPIPTVNMDTNNPFGTAGTPGDTRFVGGTSTPAFPSDSGVTSNIPGSTGFPPLPGDNDKSLLNEPATSTTSKKYTVMPNDNFSTIARDHHVSVKAIVAANPNVDSRKLKVGQEINLPANVTPLAPKVPDVGPASAAAAETTYVVKSGDTLYQLARDNKVTVKDLQRANGIVGSVIRVGQKLIIPAPANSGTNQ